ncbi:LacI family transcriptional regulator, partial [Vibrio sp. 10N.222.46.B3]
EAVQLTLQKLKKIKHDVNFELLPTLVTRNSVSDLPVTL